MENNSQFNKVCLETHLSDDFLFFMAIKLPPGEGIHGSPHFSEVSAFCQIMEALRRLLSASVDSHLQQVPWCNGQHSGL